MRRQLTIACGDYDRTHALVDGSVSPEGVDLNWLDLPHLEIWTRMLNYYDFDASEISLASFIHRRDHGQAARRHPGFSGPSFQTFLYLRQLEQRHSRAARPHGEKGRSGRVPTDRDRLGQRHFAARVRRFS